MFTDLSQKALKSDFTQPWRLEKPDELVLSIGNGFGGLSPNHSRCPPQNLILHEIPAFCLGYAEARSQPFARGREASFAAQDLKDG